MKIYTKAGDQGRTSLFGGKKTTKDDIQIEAYGTVDELNSHLGAAISLMKDETSISTLKKIQSILFDVGSHLASDGTADSYLPEIKEEMISDLEAEIDRMDAKLQPLKSFILPGGNAAISQLHICRTVCRRAERRIVTLNQVNEINPILIKYLNRLSDYFFVLARYQALLDGIDETKWNPK